MLSRTNQGLAIRSGPVVVFERFEHESPAPSDLPLTGNRPCDAVGARRNDVLGRRAGRARRSARPRSALGADHHALVVEDLLDWWQRLVEVLSQNVTGFVLEPDVVGCGRPGEACVLRPGVVALEVHTEDV